MKYCCKRTAAVIVPSIGSGIRVFCNMRSREPPSMYSIQMLISPSLQPYGIIQFIFHDY